MGMNLSVKLDVW